jgi:hypothetical protein
MALRKSSIRLRGMRPDHCPQLARASELFPLRQSADRYGGEQGQVARVKCARSPLLAPRIMSRQTVHCHLSLLRQPRGDQWSPMPLNALPSTPVIREWADLSSEQSDYRSHLWHEEPQKGIKFLGCHQNSHCASSSAMRNLSGRWTWAEFWQSPSRQPRYIFNGLRRTSPGGCCGL